MRSSGYTLIELLIVISIIALLSVVGFVNFKDFSANQVAVKAAGQVQTLLRLAQSNATSSTKCNALGSSSWSLVFLDNKAIELRCNPGNSLQKVYNLDPGQVQIQCGTTNIIPTTFTYATGVGTLTISNCSQYPVTLSATNTNNTNVLPKSFKVSSGGAINVQ